MSLRPIVAWSPWATAPLLLAGIVLLAPYLLMHGPLPLGMVIYRGFSLVCHQHPERSFVIFGAPVAVCARCLGIYLGAAAGLLLRTSRQLALRFLIAAAGLNLLDWATELAGLHGNRMWVRFALGLGLGAAGALLIASTTSRECSPPTEPASVAHGQ